MEVYSKAKARHGGCALIMALAASVLMLGGCLSVPVSTMWKMRNFSATDFQQLAPADLHAAILTESDALFVPDKVTLDLSLDVEGGSTTTYQPRMKSLSPPVAYWPGLKPAPDGWHWIVMALSDAGVGELQRFQKDMAGQPKGTSSTIMIRVTTGDADVKQPEKDYHFESWLRLRPEDGYLQLLKRTRVNLAELKNQEDNTLIHAGHRTQRTA